MEISEANQFFILAGDSRRLTGALVANPMDQGDATGDLLKGFHLPAQNGLVEALDQFFILPHGKNEHLAHDFGKRAMGKLSVDLAIPVLEVLRIFLRHPGAEDFFDLLAGRPFGSPCAEIDQLPEKFDGQILKLQGGGVWLRNAGPSNTRQRKS